MPFVRLAIEAPRGEVLVFDGEICDARFSKCCGGVTEHFENTWEPVKHSYLTKVVDSDTQSSTPDLSQEENARKWILSIPDVICNTEIRLSCQMFSTIMIRNPKTFSVGKCLTLPLNYLH